MAAADVGGIGERGGEAAVEERADDRGGFAAEGEHAHELAHALAGGEACHQCAARCLRRADHHGGEHRDRPELCLGGGQDGADHHGDPDEQ
jgi:hypothetical protein